MNIYTSIFAIILLESGSANVIPVDPSLLGWGSVNAILVHPSLSPEKEPIGLENDTGLLSNPCPNPFMGYGEYCYYFSTKDEPYLNWIQAQLKCRKMNKDATLVRPYNATIDTFITRTLMEIARRDNIADDYWMDLTMVASIDRDTKWIDVPFEYTDGTSPSYTNWWSGKPSDQEFAHCAMHHPAIDGTGNINYQWSNYLCSWTSRYICQVKQE